MLQWKINNKNNPKILDEKLRYARWNHIFLLSILSTNSLISLTGTVLIFMGKIQQGALTTIGSLASNTAIILKLNKESQERLENK